MPKIKRVLFICYANICRSPAAEVLANYYTKENNIEGLEFDSAGWHTAFPTAVQETKDYVKSKGIDMSDFKSKRITRELIEISDLIIGMEKYQLLKVRKTYKDLMEVQEKLFTLKQFNGAERKDWNIPDPYKTGRENYYRILKIIEENIEAMLNKIVKLNKLKNN